MTSRTTKNPSAGLVDLLTRSGLRGRGGAAFPTAVKVEAGAQERAGLIVNACDGEVGARKDGWVVQHRLDEVIHGVELLDAALRGRGTRYAAHRGSVTEALLLEAGLDVLSVPHRYVSSEESALVALAHGQLARPVTKPVPIVRGGRSARGSRLRPTLVLNAETVWRVSQLAQHGTDWFRSQGTRDEPGPQLVSVDGAVHTPGVVETAAGTPVSVIVSAAGGPRGSVTAYEVGGLGGGWLTPAQADRTTWSTAALAGYGLRTGPGILRIIGSGTCPVRHAARMVSWATGESAGQCGPCTFGVPHVARLLEEVVNGQGDRHTLRALEQDLGLLPGRGACHFPDGVAAYVGSTVRTFRDELDHHLRHRCSWEVTSVSAGSDLGVRRA